ncbi:hypothetical protein [Kineococcus radiotolerans]|uniref:Uncharacterized protein n=1 Tax=Kineococcus radiotolerans (strain ATCC BAA-149 / DSM 14245 / SRS30216) TaxID=266940 RepID=A6W8U8_KINRD|nr:hypothetical protein [Kineococcus radiotolerans]ABS03237.1 hypothetical protein Krad_1751 [Kineococcus radiotolerans SRS30216 = ATCC BAA-149]
MTAPHAPAALAADAETSDTAPAPENDAQRCIRRPGSTWSRCKCADCRAHDARLTKLNRTGRYNATALATAQARAFTRLEHWIALGWEPLAIASATGVAQPTCWEIVREIRAGHRRDLQHATVRRILTAGPPTAGFIGVTGTRRRLQALTWMGWGLSRLSQEIGIPVMTLSDARSDNGPSTVAAVIAATIADAYDRLSSTRLPARQPHAHAARHRWAPPAAWDDETIDDPTVTPEGVDTTAGAGTARYANEPDVVETVELLYSAGLTDQQIGYRIGLTPSGVQKLRLRHKIRRTA